LYSVSGSTWRTVGLITPIAFLAGPIAIVLVLLRRPSAPRDASARLAALLLLSLLSVTVAGLASGASVAGTLHGISQTGSGGYGVVVPVVSNAALAIRNGLLMAVPCLFFAAAVAGRARWRGRVTVSSQPEMSLPRALAWSLLLVAILVAVDQLLRAHHEAVRAWIVMADPDPARRPASLQVIAEGTLSDSLLLLLAGGFVLTVIVTFAGVNAWRALRAQRAHHLLMWVSRLALFVAAAGASYHARRVDADLASFHETIDRLIEYERANPSRRTN